MMESGLSAEKLKIKWWLYVCCILDGCTIHMLLALHTLWSLSTVIFGSSCYLVWLGT